MSLNGALMNAFSGLRANSRAATIVSTNISNATTDGYGRRDLALTAGVVGTYGGVRVDGVLRNVDPAVLADRRVSDARLGYSDDLMAFLSRIEASAGSSGSPGSLTERVTAFENALVTAASNPASVQRLETVAFAGNALAEKLNSLSSDLQAARLAADGSIGDQVTRLNDTLNRVDQLNDDIIAASTTNTDVSSLLDERQRLIDGIAEIVPLRVVQRDLGAVSLFTTGGAALLDGGAVTEIGFAPVNSIGAGMTYAAGDLSGLTLNGKEINSAANSMLAGGTLAAQFAIRDDVAPAEQARLDALARDLAERLGAGGPDTTLAPGDAGLFTDAGSAFDTANEEGFAGRIALNALVTPGSGESWRLRDGLGAAAPGASGDARLLQGISAALSVPAVPGSGALAPVARSFADQAAEFSSGTSAARVREENNRTYLAAQNTALKEREFSQGVDTDQELQRLMLIEQHYAANARVMSAVDQLMERLLAI